MKNSTPARSINYPSDLTDTEWEIVSSIITEADPYTTGRPRTSDLREILNAIYYLTQQPPAKAGGLKLRTESPDTGR